MEKMVETPHGDLPDERLIVPSKADILAILQQDGNRAGLPVEWMLDRCDKKDRTP